MAMASRRRPIFRFVGLSLLVHMHLALVVVALLAANPDGCAHVDSSLTPIEVSLVPASEETPEDKARELEEQQKEEEEEEKKLEGQVVDLPPPLEEKRPKKARFLSEYDSKVRKQTKAVQMPRRPGAVARPSPPVPRRHPPAGGRPGEPTGKRAPDKRSAKKPSPKKAMKLAMRTRPDLPRSDLDPSDRGKSAPRRQRDERPAARGPKRDAQSERSREAQSAKKSEPRQQPRGQKRRRLTMKDLKLSDARAARSLGNRVIDALQDVEEGKQTLLNSKRWRFASFFNRVKRQVAQNWHPNLVYRRRDPSGNVYGFKDRLTILRVKLSPKGELKGVHLEKASGVGFLDDEAISAFRAAQPFPNPPKGLVDKKTGLISFRFGFLFEISRRPSFRIFRYR